jgi:hypothetical protein
MNSSMAPAWTAVFRRGPLVRRLNAVDGSIGSTIDPESISIANRIIVACLQAVAIYNAVELVAIIFFTFKRRQGLYFWSMMVSTFGVALNACAFVVNDFGLTSHRIIPALMIIGGWVPMTTGQAFVLYSRLHLLYLDARSLRLVLTMIITVGIIGHLPTAVVIFGSNSSNPGPFLVPYSVYEKIEVTLFFIQEVILSGIYLWKCMGFWKSQRMREATQIRGIIQHLVAVNLLIVALDVTILWLEYSGMYIIQTSYKAFVYSVKLKVEISILNRLVDFVRATRRFEFHDRITKEMEQEWSDTLQRTIGTDTTTTAKKVAQSVDVERVARAEEQEEEKSMFAPAMVASATNIKLEGKTSPSHDISAKAASSSADQWPFPAALYFPKEVKRRGKDLGVLGTA